MRIITTAARAVLGGYLAVHGAQKLFGLFGGHGLDATAQGFEKLGLTPGRETATLAGAAELGGGLLTATGIADPLGPISIMGAMTVAAAVHRGNGPLAANGGYEMPLTNLAFAALLAVAPHGGFRLGPSLPRRIVGVVVAGCAALSAVAVAKLFAGRRRRNRRQRNRSSLRSPRSRTPDDRPPAASPADDSVAERGRAVAGAAGRGAPPHHQHGQPWDHGGA